MVDLPLLPAMPACPAALTLSGVCASQQGVVCRVMQADQESDPGLRMTAGALGWLREAEGGVYLNLKGDPSTVTAFCHGTAVPVVHGDESSRASYTVCPVWQAEKARIAAGRDRLYVEAEPEPVSMGMESSLDDPDPWRQARRDLDLLAPQAAG